MPSVTTVSSVSLRLRVVIWFAFYTCRNIPVNWKMMCRGQDRYIPNIFCVSGREGPREEPTFWKRKAKDLTETREKQKDQAKGEELSEAERVCLGGGSENATLHRSSDCSRKSNWASS